MLEWESPLTTHSETKGFFSHLFPGAKEDRGCVCCHRSLPPEWPSGHSTVHDGNPGITQVVHQREQMDCVHRYIGRIYAHLHCKACTEIPVVHGQWSNVLVQLGHLPSGIYQGGQVASEGQAPCLLELLVYLHLIPIQARTHANLVLRVLQHLGWVINFSKSDLSPSQQFNFIVMQFSMCTNTVTPLPKMESKSRTHWKSHPLVTARDLHKILGILTFMSSLVPRDQLCLHAQSSDGHQRPGVRRQGPGQTGFQWPWPFSMRRLGGPPLQCCRGLTECLRGRDHSLYRCLQPQMGA